MASDQSERKTEATNKSPIGSPEGGGWRLGAFPMRDSRTKGLLSHQKYMQRLPAIRLTGMGWLNGDALGMKNGCVRIFEKGRKIDF